MHHIKPFIESHFSLVMIGMAIIGFGMPGIELIPKTAALLMLGGIIFFSCVHITFEDLKKADPIGSLGFYIARFLVLPLCLYLIAKQVAPDLKEAILLLALTPAGSTSPTFAQMMGGNVALALGLVIVSACLAPFVIPGAFGLLGYGALDLDVLSMFRSLAIVVFLPIALWFALGRRSEALSSFAKDNSKWISILLISCVIALVVAHQRAFIWENLEYIALSTIAVLGIYALFYLIAVFWPFASAAQNRMSYIANSTINNNTLGITIAALYFEPSVALFMVITIIPWISAAALLPLLAKKATR